MHHDSLPPKMPVGHRWTLWTRDPLHPRRWRLRATGALITVEEIADEVQGAEPWVSTLILPAMESPIMPKGKCHQDDLA